MSETEKEKYLIIAINKRSGKPQLVSEVEGIINMPEFGNDFWGSFKSTLAKELLPMRDNHFVKLSREDFEKRLENWKNNGVSMTNEEIKDSLLDPNFENIKNEEARPYKFDESKINWASIERNHGISKEQLRVSGALDQLLLGDRTSRLFDVKVKLGNELAMGKGRLYLKEGLNGNVYMNTIQKLDNPQLDKAYFGHIFTDDEQKNLLNWGNAGNLITINPKNGAQKDVFVSLDPETNQLVNASPSSIYIQDKTMGIELEKKMMEELKLGHPVKLSGKNSEGKPWEADVQINAVTRRVEFVQEYANQQKRSERIIAGVPISDAQWDLLCEGKRMELTGMEVNTYKRDSERNFVLDKDDQKIPIGKEKCNGWVYLENGKPKIEFTREICGKRTSHDEHRRIEAGEKVYLYNMKGKPKKEGEDGKNFNAYVSLNKDGKYDFDVNSVYISQRPKIRLDGKEFQIELEDEKLTDLYAGSTVKVIVKDAKQQDINIWLRVDTEESGKQRLKPYNYDPAQMVVPRNDILAKHNNEGITTEQNKDLSAHVESNETKTNDHVKAGEKNKTDKRKDKKVKITPSI